MVEQGLITKPDSGTDRYFIDYKGWQRLDEIRKDNKQFNKGFVAMMFRKDMKDVEKAILEAIHDCGYLPMIISQKEHNNEIVPEILYEIRTSDFIVADLTGNRGGVYYEAGFALGLGKEIIFTVNNSKTKKNEAPHFDVAQRKQVRYDSPKDLKKKLIKRIISTVGNKK